MLRSRFDKSRKGGRAGTWIALVALAVSGCANVGQGQGGQAGAPASGVAVASAPSTPASSTVADALPVVTASAAPLKKGPPLVYRMRRGDTLARVAQTHHCSVKQLQAWNGLKPSARLKPGQILKVASPEAVRAANAQAAAARTAANAAPVATNPSVGGNTAASADQTAQNTAANTTATAANQTAQNIAANATPSSPAPNAADAREVTQQTQRHATGVALAWPAKGSVVEGFQAGETRGIEIGGKSGDPVRAAADGKVMFAGTGLNGYGSLIIVQHNKDFLTAYSHTRKLLVKTGDIVRQGQLIAEMGDAVGFELRRDGKPIDPMPYLPSARG